jgi:hypothetical protein
MNHLAGKILFLAVGLLVVIAALRIPVCWKNDTYLGNPSGTWLSLATDLKDGIFYRPIVGNDGYGGTRYFPLTFVLMAGMMRLGVGPALSGHLLSLAAMLLLMAGMYFLLRRLEVEKSLAFVSALLVLASASSQEAILSIRGDVIPAALNIWGLIFIVSRPASTRNLLFASIFFALAFSAKVSTVFGFMAAFLHLLFLRNFRNAIRLAIFSAVLYVVVLVCIYFASNGNAFESFRVGGSTSVRLLLFSPLRTFNLILDEDPASTPFLLLAFVSLIAAPKANREIPSLLFISALLVTFLILSMRGTDSNHLLDLNIASIVALSTWLSREQYWTGKFGIPYIAIAILFAVSLQLKNYRDSDRSQQRANFKQIIHLLSGVRRPILAENQLLDVYTGHRPYIIDPLVFRILNNQDSSFGSSLRKKIRNKQFGAIVLLKDPKLNPDWFRTFHFGTGFVEELNAHYELAEVVGGEFIYLPRKP